METVDKGIHINRGDRGTIRIKSKKGKFKVGDKLKFSIKTQVLKNINGTLTWVNEE